MHIPEYINKTDEAVHFCDRYKISYTISPDNQLMVTNPPSIDYHSKFTAMTDAARKSGIGTDHPNCFLTDPGVFIATFSNYEGELTEKDQANVLAAFMCHKTPHESR